MPRFYSVLLVLCLSGCYVDPYTHAPTPAPTDWYHAGWEDAMAGQPLRSNLVLAHLHNDDKVDRKAWLKGYARGQDRICDSDFLYLLGLSGKRFPASCETVPAATSLQSAWQKGIDAGMRDGTMR
ncbi:DUF2799 domain-containing protein [Enterobacteriaceae bacterium H20N1]|uniref:DUF2799 domain-containing protein n=1 Tax=Dryocola boscaweniae TaxID=2925397 RepID=A0A9X3AP51_9ENTR|nr:DUF2799 domain-containing protein [Dryocola boscaweniae]MCT4700565.1 DUF2799 domain-containing protein [Dryocola boscaweniae]MCT4715301.1 DUF2799 domain-containing protein [Dryocola boscaweniae]MCT4717721.1 DUF2799 domain-containing protein [Dryocola boscaweniae]